VKQQTIKLGELAQSAAVELHGDPECEITGVASLAAAKPGQLTFLLGGSYQKYLASTKASAVILTESDLLQCPSNALVTRNPELTFAKILPMFEKRSAVGGGIHSGVTIGRDCQIDSTVSIAPGCVIGDGVCIGKNAVISAHTVIGDRVVIGDDFYAYPNVVLYHDIQMGDRVILHSGSVIGSDGFGLTNDQGRWIKIPQVGSVVLGNDVEVGANTTVDRGALESTIIEEGVKIDNQVQVAHNVRIGAHTVVAGCVGIAGSAQIGSHCVIGGGVCITGHIKIADQVVITGMAMVTHSIDAPGVYSSGTGLQTNLEWRKSAVRFQQLDKIVKRIQKLERLNDE